MASDEIGELLAALDAVGFEACEAGYRAIGDVPECLARRFPALATEPLDLGSVFPFLAHFLAEAQRFWDGGADRSALRYGFWTETDASGAPCQLEATAVQLAGSGRRLLLLGIVDERYDRIHGILQAAREHSLAFERLRKAQASLSESESRFRTLADGAPVMIWITDPDDRFVWFNRTWEAFTGRSRRDDWTGVLHPDDRASLLAELSRRFAARAGFEVEFRLRRRDGTFRCVLGSCIPRLAEDGAFLGFTACCLDVTEQKQALAMLEGARDDLERRVDVTTEQLVETNRRLVAQREQLRELADRLTFAEERERRRIATELHDRIGQSLAVAKIHLGLLGQEADRRELVDKVDSLRGIIDEAILFTRDLTFDLAPPVLYELGLEPALKSLTARMERRYGLAATFRDDGVAKPLDENTRTILFQSVQELLHNVAKHARARSVEVSSARDGEVVEVVVADDGVGFAAPASGESRGGDGFGLFNIRERVGYLGGEVSFHSRPGGGTRVVLRARLRGPSATV